MLVLSRKTHDAILIGQDVRIVVLGVEGTTVKIGIDAPRSLQVTREELLLDTVKSNREAIRATKVTAKGISFNEQFRGTNNQDTGVGK